MDKPVTQTFIDTLETKKYRANKADRASNTDKIVQKLDELKPKEIGLANFADIQVVTLKGDKGEKGDKGDKGNMGLIGPQGDKGDWVEGPQGETGPQGPQGETGTPGKNGKNGKDGTQITPQQIVEKLTTLKNAWIDVRAIKGLDEFLKSIPQSKGFVPNALASLYDVDVKNISDQQALIWDGTKKKFVPGSASSGTGFTKLNATGAVDGANTTFTFTSKPTYIVSDGAWYVENSGWTYSGSTATMSVPPQTGIFGFV